MGRPNTSQIFTSQSFKKSFVLLLIFGVLVVLAASHTASQSSSTGSVDVINFSTEKPDESKQNAKEYDWHGAAEDPKSIKISSLGVDSYIQKVDVDQNTRVAVPSNVHLAGWFVGSVRPGEKGLSIIDGHVGGRTANGVFKKLGRLKIEDTFEVERGDGKILQYKVIKTTTVLETESASVMFSQNPKVASQLNLITCAGQYTAARHTYSDRVVIYAALQR